MAFDPTKPVQTRDGRPARIICTDCQGRFPILALVFDNINNQEIVWPYDIHGHLYGDHTSSPSNLNLVNIPTKRTGWINIYKSANWVQTFTNKEDAIATGMRSKSYVTTIQIEWEE